MKLSAATLSNRIAAVGSYLPLGRKIDLGTPAGASMPGIEATATSHARPRKPSRLCNTFYLTMPADEAMQALRNLTLERFSLQFATIPATGGCVVAVYAPPMPEPDFIWRFRIARQQQDAVRLLTSLGATAV